MTSHDSWSIPGIDWETREAAREAARRAGLPVAEWLEEVIAEQAPGRDKPARIPGNRRRARRQVAREIERLQAELDVLDDESPDRDFNSIAGAVASLAGRTAGGESETRTMVARLAEQLAEIAEAGKGNRAPAIRQEPEFAQIADAMRRAGERTQPSQASQAISPRRGADERREILENLRDRVEALRSDGGQPTERTQPAPAAARVAELNRTISQLRERLEALRANTHGGPAPSAVGATEDRDEAPSRPEPASGFDLKRAIAEIAARQEALDRMGLVPSASATISAAEPDSSPDFNFDFGDLGDTRPAAPDTADLSLIEAELTRLDQAVATIGPGTSGASSEMAAIRAELQALRAGLDEAARETSVQSLEAGYGHLVERLDSMSRIMPDRDRIEELAAAISQLGRALAHSESDRDISRLEAQIATIADAIDELGARAGSPALDRRLDEIGEAIEGLQDFGRLSEKEAERRFSQMEASIGGRLTVETARNETLERLDNRLAEVAGRIDAALSGSAQANLASDLLGRMEELTSKLDAALAQRAPPQADALETLTKEIGALRRDIAAGSKPAVEAIESQVEAIVRRLDTMPGPQNDGAALAQLEGQVATLAEKIDSVALRPAALDHVEANLAALEALLRQSREESSELARSAAREAVESLSAPTLEAAGGNLAMQGLQDDLRALQSAAEDKDLQTKDSLGTVQDALDRVSERLSMLETVSRREAAGDGAAYAPAGRRLIRREGIDRSTLLLDRPVANRPVDQGEARATDSEPVLELDKRSEAPAGRRADFIAAARRAAQAAAAESASLQEAETTGRRNPLSLIGQVFSKRRRPVLLAAAAVVLTIAALKLFAAIGDGGTVAMAKADAAPVGKLSGDRAPATTRAFVQPAGEPTPASDASAARSASGAADQTTLVALAADDVPQSRFSQSGAGLPAASFAADPTATPAAAALAAFASPGADQAAGTLPSAAAPLPDVSVGPTDLRKAAAAGDPAALFEVASRYADGRVVGQDLKQAANWYSEAAKRGLPIAAVRLAGLYEHGTGVARDRIAAASWYQKAADAGNIRAMHNLAVLLSEGVADQPDYVGAAAWFAKAAERGVKDSQYNLGVMYARGLGLNQDLVQAYRWFALAAAQGDTDAGSRRDDVAKTLSPDQLAQARLAVQGWQATKALEAANAEPKVKTEWTAPPQRRATTDHVDLVRRVQALLTQQGYDVGPADGREGPKTRIAVKALQHKLGTPETGTIDSTLVAALGEAL